ncbi:MAG TPA: glucoamylase family protein [Candidatus Limnocylindria bacterium]|nr:glucoamylase family protein [Candidatus Limnocylindria bacterium]
MRTAGWRWAGLGLASALAASACGVTMLWRPEPAPVPAIVPVRKKAWEASLGGREAAKPALVARLAGWPTRLTVPASELPLSDEAFLYRLAQDTWRGIDAMVDLETGLPIDHLRFLGGVIDPASTEIGDYTSTTNIGLYLAAVAGAHHLGLISRDAALARLRAVLATLRRMEQYRGFLFNFYDTVSLERTSSLVSFVDSSWLLAGLIVARQTFPELRDPYVERVAHDFNLFYDPRYDLMTHGYDVRTHRRSIYHYGTFYTEARLGNLLAIGLGEAPRELWFAMDRTYPASRVEEYRGPARADRPAADRIGETFYEWQGVRYVPSWGGSMFEALMPTLFLDELRLAPRSLGANDAAHVKVQRRYARRVLDYPVWGMSPCMLPSGAYAEFGVPPLGVRGYEAGPVTPHASALALAVAPRAATRNLRALAERYPIYGEYGFYDSVLPASGEVGTVYLTLDQAMIFLALVNHLGDGAIQRAFAADPVVAPVLPLVAKEHFFG